MTEHYTFLDLTTVNEPYYADLVQAAERVIRSGRYIGGPEVETFEQSLADMTVSRYATGVSNGLDALRLSLRAFIELGRLKPGDGVIVAANTYIASVLAIADAALVPLLTDPDPVTMNLSAQGIAKAISDAKVNVGAVMPVHLYGRVAWNSEMRQICLDNNLIIIEDCAQAIGAVATAPGLNGSYKAGGLGHAAAFSFYPTKNIGALGDAGAVTTSDHELAAAVRALANYGSDSRYHNIYTGFNCRMDPIQAAMLAVKLPHTEEENSIRHTHAEIYNRYLNHQAIIRPHMSEAVSDCVWHQYVIRVPGDIRDLLREQLKERGVETDIHYAVPPHLQPCFRSFDHPPLPVTEMLASEIISLPISRGTSDDDCMAIASIINETISNIYGTTPT